MFGPGKIKGENYFTLKKNPGDLKSLAVKLKLLKNNLSLTVYV